VTAVELNLVTVSLVREHFADFTGRLAERPGKGSTFTVFLPQAAALTSRPWPKAARPPADPPD
jgi:hypothetical protein